MSALSTTPETILASLTRIVHPDYGIDVVNLGMVYGIELNRDLVTITMSHPSPVAKDQQLIVESITRSLKMRHPDLTEVRFTISNDPPWRDDFITAEGQLQLSNPIPAAPAGDLSEDAVLDSLTYVIDPEVGVNIVDLGLIYGVGVEDRVVTITMTLTTPGCPLHATIEEAVRRVIETRYPDVVKIDVVLVWKPVWVTDRISDEGRRALGW